jgi:flagellar hook-basal body complex protein FliE
MRIDSISTLQTNPSSQVSKPNNGGEDFGKMLTDALKEVNDAQINASQVQKDLMAGRKVEPHELGIALERASIALELTMQVRNKLLEAFQEIQRTQV